MSVTKNSNSKFSALVLDRDPGFSRGHQSDDEDQDEVDEEEVKDDKNDNEEAEEDDKEEDPSVPKKLNSNFSALVIDRDLGFSRGHQTKPNHTKPYQTIPYQTKPNQGYLSSGTR